MIKEFTGPETAGSGVMEDQGVEEGPLKEPESSDEALGLIDRSTRYLATKFYTLLSQYHMGRAEGKLISPQLRKSEEILEGTDKFKELRWAASGIPLKERITGDWETYLQKAEARRVGIRKENVESYLALRKARDVAKTPEEKAELKELFERQTRLRHLMHTPEYTHTWIC